MTILILHGPNLNLLGKREPETYGSLSLDKINTKLVEMGKKLGIDIICQQSNHEGVLIDILHKANEWANGVVFNPGGYAHTSVALRDAVDAIDIPVVEVHISNIYAREYYRNNSLLSEVCSGIIAGFGWRSYELGLISLLS